MVPFKKWSGGSRSIPEGLEFLSRKGQRREDMKSCGGLSMYGTGSRCFEVIRYE